MSSEFTETVSRRRFLQATGAAAGAAALAGCASDDGPGDGEGNGDVEKGGTFRRTLTGTITTFDPVAATDTASGLVIQQVNDALMSYPDGKQAVEQQLATNYEVSDDYTTYTFTLKEGVKYHTGDEVTAQDFVYAWERLVRSPHSARSYFALESLGISHETNDDGYVADSLAVEAKGDYTLEIQLDGPFASTLQMLAYTSFAPLPDGHLGAIGDEADDEGEPTGEYNEFATKNPIGTGAFQNVDWNSGESAELEAFDDYHGTGPHLDGVHIRVLEEDSARYKYVQNNNADFFTIPTSQYDPSLVNVDETDDLDRGHGTYGPMQNGDTVNYGAVPEVGTYYFAFNTQAVPKPVRQAIAYVTNQQQFIDSVWKGRYEPAYHLTPKGIFPGGADGYDQHVEEAYPYSAGETDIESAKQVMEDAGYGPNDKFDLTFTHYVSDTWSQISQLLRDQVDAAHINMTVESAEFSAMLQRGRNGQLQAYTLGWIADWPAPDNFLQLVYPPRTNTSEPGPLTYTDWHSSDTEAKQQAQEAFETVLNNRAPTDEAEQTRNDAYLEIEEANWEDAVLVNAFHPNAEPMWYDHVHMNLHGAMGDSRQQYNEVWKEQSN